MKISLGDIVTVVTSITDLKVGSRKNGVVVLARGEIGTYSLLHSDNSVTPIYASNLDEWFVIGNNPADTTIREKVFLTK